MKDSDINQVTILLEIDPVHLFTKGREVLRKYNEKLNFAVAVKETKE